MKWLGTAQKHESGLGGNQLVHSGLHPSGFQGNQQVGMEAGPATDPMTRDDNFDVVVPHMFDFKAYLFDKK